MATFQFDDQPPTPTSEYGDIKQSQIQRQSQSQSQRPPTPESARETRPRPKPKSKPRRTRRAGHTRLVSKPPMVATTRHSVAAVHPGRHLLGRLTHAPMSCGSCVRSFCTTCLGGNAKTVDSPIPPPGRKGNAAAAAAENALLHATPFTDSESLAALKLTAPTPLHPLWPAFAQTLQKQKDAARDADMAQKRAAYKQGCQALYERMIATEPAKYGDLDTGITLTSLAAPRIARVRATKADGQDCTSPTGMVPVPGGSAGDGSIPLVKFAHTKSAAAPAHVVVYYHGGGLLIGDALSEQLSCRFILRHFDGHGGGAGSVVLYSVDYRLKPGSGGQHDVADACVHDCIDAYTHIRAQHADARLYIVGSSSGGEMAAFVAQQVKGAGSGLAGVALRSPVTSDAFNGAAYVPAHLQDLHTTAHEAFYTAQLGRMARSVPRDGLQYMPLEAPRPALHGLPRHWIQISTNDALYADGLCYAKLVREHGGEAAVQVVHGQVHTNWLLTPWWDEAYAAEMQMVHGLNWLAGGPAQNEWK